MNVQNRDISDERAVVRAIAPRSELVRLRQARRRTVAILLSFALFGTVMLFMIATYPLWPRLYLSPVLEMWPSLADIFLRLFSSKLARQAVDATGGNVFFYLFTLAVVSLFVVYLATLHWSRAVRPSRAYLRWALASAALAGLLLVIAPTLFTTDIFSYVMYGRLAAEYGANPFVTPPSKFPDDPVFDLVFWKDTVSVYGPAWIDLSYVVMRLVRTSVGEEIAAFKVLALVFHVANAFLVWKILSCVRPRDRLTGTLAYAWNPLLLIEFAGNGHNDAVMLFFMLLAALAIVRGHRNLPMAYLMVAILTKWIAVFVLPIFIIQSLRDSTSARDVAAQLCRLMAVALAIAGLLYGPYWAGVSTFTAMFDSAAVEQVINSFAELTSKAVAAVVHDIVQSDNSDTDKLVQYLLKALFGVVFLVLWLREVLHSRDSDEVAIWWLRTIFVYLAVACTWFWPWYITWLVPFAAIDLDSRWAKATLLFTFTGTLFYSLWPGAPLRPFEPFYNARAVVLFAPPLLYLAGSIAVERWRSFSVAREATLEE